MASHGIISAFVGAVSSAVEHCLHTAGVAGSNPAPPTSRINDLRHFRVPFAFPVGQKWAKPAPARSWGRMGSAPWTRCLQGSFQPTPAARACLTHLALTPAQWRAAAAVRALLEAVWRKVETMRDARVCLLRGLGIERHARRLQRRKHAVSRGSFARDTAAARSPDAIAVEQTEGRSARASRRRSRAVARLVVASCKAARTLTRAVALIEGCG